MPNCFELRRKTDGERENFSVIDDLMREHFGAPPDPDKYYRGWYDGIGLALAMGMTFEQIVAKYEEISEKDGAAIARWLDEHYVSGAWYAPRSITG